MVTITLLIRNRERRGERVVVDSAKFLIGRHSSANLRLECTSVSRRHCLLRRQADGVTIQDLGSRNGTKVNGELLKQGEVRHLGHHDKFQLGAWKLRLSVRDAATKRSVKRRAGSPAESALSEASMSATESQTGESPASMSAADLLKELDSLTTELELNVEKKNQEMEWRDLSRPTQPIDQHLGGESERPTQVEHGPSDETKQVTKSEAESPPPSTPTVEDSADPSSSSEEEAGEEVKQDGPGKLPEHLRPRGPNDSTDAAAQALRRYFSGS
ncbi:MAG: FHA domain-containing protein [Pirellulales bacterium]|nr:FHA domain-containing protein [Pirellulales bacterium]